MREERRGGSEREEKEIGERKTQGRRDGEEEDRELSGLQGQQTKMMIASQKQTFVFLFW